MELGYTSVIPYFVIMALLFWVSGLLLRKLSFFQKIAKAEVSERYESLDGLRGILAIGVFFQHAIQNYSFFQTGIWQITDVRFYRFLGGEAVILFFITTSFLYWSKVISKAGGFDMLRFYRSRLFRLAPLYLFSGFLVSVIALYNTGFEIVSVSSLFRDIFFWFTQGLKTISTFNDFNIIPINAGIHWTLRYEWAFYLLLPLSALTIRSIYGKIFSILILLGIFLMPDRGYWVIFLFGILSAYVVYYYPTFSWFKNNKWSALVPIIGLILVFFIDYKPYGYIQYFISFLVFLSFVYGNNLFGLLKTPTAKFLSTISYSIYLLHGIVLYFILRAVDMFYPIKSLSPLSFWTMIIFAGIIVIMVSCAGYRFIEHPFIQRIKAKKKDVPMPVGLIDRVI